MSSRLDKGEWRDLLPGLLPRAKPAWLVGELRVPTGSTERASPHRPEAEVSQKPPDSLDATLGAGDVARVTAPVAHGSCARRVRVWEDLGVQGAEVPSAHAQTLSWDVFRQVGEQSLESETMEEYPACVASRVSLTKTTGRESMHSALCSLGPDPDPDLDPDPDPQGTAADPDAFPRMLSPEETAVPLLGRAGRFLPSRSSEGVWDAAEEVLDDEPVVYAHSYIPAPPAVATAAAAASSSLSRSGLVATAALLPMSAAES